MSVFNKPEATWTENEIISPHLPATVVSPHLVLDLGTYEFALKNERVLRYFYEAYLGAMNQPESKPTNNDGKGCCGTECGCLLLCLFLGFGWLIVDFIQSQSREHFSEEPYFIGGTHSNVEEQQWLEEAEQQWLIAQSTETPAGTQLVFSFPITAQMAMIASEQGYGNIMDRPQPEREAIYRQAAPLAHTASALYHLFPERA